MGLTLHPSKISLPNFYPPHIGVGPATSASVTLLTSLGGCGFFNSAVVRLPFTSISDSSEMIILYLSYNFDVVVQRGKPYLPMLPS